jgi:hypothetical protein
MMRVLDMVFCAYMGFTMQDNSPSHAASHLDHPFYRCMDLRMACLQGAWQGLRVLNLMDVIIWGSAEL